MNQERIDSFIRKGQSAVKNYLSHFVSPVNLYEIELQMLNWANDKGQAVFNCHVPFFERYTFYISLDCNRSEMKVNVFDTKLHKYVLRAWNGEDDFMEVAK